MCVLLWHPLGRRAPRPSPRLHRARRPLTPPARARARARTPAPLAGLADFAPKFKVERELKPKLERRAKLGLFKKNPEAVKIVDETGVELPMVVVCVARGVGRVVQCAAARLTAPPPHAPSQRAGGPAAGGRVRRTAGED